MRSAALIKNHGAVGVGRDLREALAVCALLERVAQIFVFAKTAGRFDELPREAVEAENGNLPHEEPSGRTLRLSTGTQG